MFRIIDSLIQTLTPRRKKTILLNKNPRTTKAQDDWRLEVAATFVSLSTLGSGQSPTAANPTRSIQVCMYVLKSDSFVLIPPS